MSEFSFKGSYMGDGKATDAMERALDKAHSTNTSKRCGEGEMARKVQGSSLSVGYAEITPKTLAGLVRELHSEKITLAQASFGETTPEKSVPQYALASLTKEVIMPEGCDDAGDVLVEVIKRTQATAMSLVNIQLALENPATREAILSVDFHTKGFEQNEQVLRIIGNGRRISGEVAKALTAIGIPVQGTEFAVVDMKVKKE